MHFICHNQRPFFRCLQYAIIFYLDQGFFGRGSGVREKIDHGFPFCGRRYPLGQKMCSYFIANTHIWKFSTVYTHCLFGPGGQWLGVWCERNILTRVTPSVAVPPPPGPTHFWHHYPTPTLSYSLFEPWGCWVEVWVDYKNLNRCFPYVAAAAPPVWHIFFQPPQ